MFESKINRGKANGYAPLDGSGKVPLDKLPPIQSTIDTGSFATTGSNTFTGTQTIVGTSGSLIVEQGDILYGQESFIITATGSAGLLVTSNNISLFGVTEVNDVENISNNASLFANITNTNYGGGVATGPVASILTLASGSIPNYWFFDTSGSSFLPGDVYIGHSGLGGNYSGSLNVTNGNINVSGSVYFGIGSSITETSSSIIITPAGAAAGQSLVVRQTAPINLYSDHPSGFYSGDTITLTFSPNGSQVTGTSPYVFTGCTQEQLGTSLSGSLIFNNEENKTLTWTIPLVSDISGFTFEIYNFVLEFSQSISLSSSGSSEHSHIHLVSGDPSTVDIYLGDDDQYVKIEKNGGDVVVGTNLDTHHWRFDNSGSLTTPGNIIVSGSVNISSSLVVSSTFMNNGTIDALNSDLIIDGGDIILSGSFSVTGSVNIDNVIKLTPVETFPTGQAGMLVASASYGKTNLYIYDGSDWKWLVTGSIT